MEFSGFSFNPFLSTRQEVETFVKTLTFGTAVPFRSGESKLLLSWDGENICEKDVSNEDPQKFINVANLSDLESGFARYVQTFNAQLAPFKDFTIQAISAGETLEIPHPRGAIGAFVASDKSKGPTYFDFVLYHVVNNKVERCITYGNRNGGGFDHSGDIGGLLHTIKFSNEVNSHFVLAVVGYQKTALRRFDVQLPVVFLVNHQSETINMVPCPLDQATLGDATMSGLVVAQVVQGNIRYCVLPAPIVVNGVNTGDMSQRTMDTVLASIQQANTIWNTPPVQPVQQEIDTAPVFHAPLDTAVEKLEVSSMMQFIERGLETSVFEGFQNFYFGLGFDTAAGEPCIANLPHLFGPCSNIAACLLGETSKVPGLCAETFSGTFPVVHLSDRWLDSIPASVSFRGNGLFILHPTQNLDKVQEILAKVDAVKRRMLFDSFLGNICINGLCQAGPNSIVLIELLGFLYWFRGVRVPGLLDHIPNFGDPVSHIFSQEVFTGAFNTPWPTVVSVDDTRVFWKNEMREMSDLVDYFASQSLQFFSENQDDILDLLTQISVIFSQEKTLVWRNQLISLLNHLIDLRVKPLRDEHLQKTKESFAEGSSEESMKAMRNRVVALKHATREFHSSVQRIANALKNLVSIQGASSQNQNLKRLERAAAISSNVEKAKNATLDQRIEMIEEHCATYGLAITNLEKSDTGVLKAALEAVGNNKFLEWLNSPQMCLVSSLSDRMPILDGMTLGLMLEQTKDEDRFFLYGPRCIVAMPQGHQGNARFETAFPLPLVDDFVNLEHPSQIGWIEETKKSSFNNLWRIWMRETVSQATACRDFNIHASSKDLGFFLIHTVLSTIENIISGLDHVPSSEDTTCQILRGLFGQLFSIMASGNTPMCMAFQFVYENPKLENLHTEEWTILCRMAKAFRYTGWDTTNIINNCRKFLSRIVRKLTDRVTKPIRDSLSALAGQSIVEDRERKDPDMVKLAVLIEVLFNMAEHSKHENCSENMAIAQRLLEIAIPAGKSGQRLVRFVERVAKGDAIWKQFPETLQMALNIFTKRSACFKEVKQELLEAFDADDVNEWSTKFNKFEDLVSELKHRAGDAPDVKIQNTKAISAKDRKGLKGDAERNQRVPWSVSGKTPDYDRIQSDIYYVLHGKKAKTTKSMMKADQDKEMIPEESRVVRVLSSIGNNKAVSKAITFARALPEAWCQELLPATVVPFNHFCDLMRISGIQSEADLNQLVKALFEHFLMEWKTEPLLSETRALPLFNKK